MIETCVTALHRDAKGAPLRRFAASRLARSHRFHRSLYDTCAIVTTRAAPAKRVAFFTKLQKVDLTVA